MELQRIFSQIHKGIFFPDIIENWIVNHGVDPNVRDNVKQWPLIMHLINYSSTGNVTFQNNLLRTFKFLLQRSDIDVNIQVSGHGRLIHMAASAPNPRFLLALLNNREGKLGIDYPRMDGLTALHIACEAGNTILPINVKCLLDSGANPTIKSRRDSKTPLHYVIKSYFYHENEAVLRYILKEFLKNSNMRLGDPNLRDMSGNTILHYAAQMIQSKDICSLLLEKGESKSIQVMNELGSTPIQDAENVGNIGFMQAFQQYRHISGRLSSLSLS